jgi:hypothetical protein
MITAVAKKKSIPPSGKRKQNSPLISSQNLPRLIPKEYLHLVLKNSCLLVRAWCLGPDSSLSALSSRSQGLAALRACRVALGLRVHFLPRIQIDGDQLLRRPFQARGQPCAPRSGAVRGTRGRPLVTAVSRQFWHGRGTPPGCKTTGTLLPRGPNDAAQSVCGRLLTTVVVCVGCCT